LGHGIRGAAVGRSVQSVLLQAAAQILSDS